MTTVDPQLVAQPALPARRRSGAFRRLLRRPLGVSALAALLAIVALGLLEPVLSIHDPNFADLAFANAAPGTPDWPLGGDRFGRDIWARSLAAINVSVISGLIGAGTGLVLGTVFGLISGYIGRRVDGVLSWTFNLLMTFPALVLVIVLYPVTGGTYQSMMFIFGVFLAPGIFRLVRNLVVGVRSELYVDAARVSGLSDPRILSRHVLYIIRGPIIISAAFLASAAVGVQAGLAFLGLGSNQVPSFGSMTSDAFINIYSQPVQLVWPSLFLSLLIGSLVLLGNAYRDVLAAPQGASSSSSRRRRPGEKAAAVDARMDRDDTSTPTLSAPTLSTTSPATPAGGLLRVRELRVEYPQPDDTLRAVVDGVSFDVAQGEIVGLVGESGSGKTQTAFSILGLLPPQARISANELSIAGENVIDSHRTALRKLRGSVIAYIPQEPMANLDPSFTVGSQLVEGLTSRMSRKEATATILELLARVGIPDPMRTFKSYPHEISGGMAQRALIAGAVAGRPKLLIADEPTTALDVTVQAEILDLLRDLQSEYGMGVLLVTHNFGVVADLCDRVLVMRNGVVVESGAVREIFRNPQHEYTQKLISSILDEDTVRTDLPVTAKDEG
ncbi:dipeptide/oligopeptide/nickel ABC transporter permease/ATP-binding protein [Agromyces albus]|uniref:Dipeptide/oligopeptide/nickel ABC transporter permease/ATP-binding protein n=1 Tax=Agromyces albus TaxID=205332 RepID=A0A4Q2KNU9_9MICO|nr:dipeptide/oligopeptide/nickel ABC transporter permease/ATP-binding protein [Agromyces albus]RXZ67044.1 dipeptide/oligopeptide/nickel ABC transporter permease/ATP-binding protein [Agromyces albus]